MESNSTCLEAIRMQSTPSPKLRSLHYDLPELHSLHDNLTRVERIVLSKARTRLLSEIHLYVFLIYLIVISTMKYVYLFFMMNKFRVTPISMNFFPPIVRQQF